MKFTPLEVYRLIKNYRQIRETWEVNNLLIAIWDIDMAAEHLNEKEYEFLVDWILCEDDFLIKLYKEHPGTIRQRKYRLAIKLSKILNRGIKG